jgi:hypothetical protein
MTTDMHVSLVVSASRSFPHSWLFSGFVIRLTRRLPLVEPELPTLPEHMSSPAVIRGVRVTRFLVLWCMFCRSLFVLLYIFFWPLCCLLFFDIRILLTLLVSLNSSYIIWFDTIGLETTVYPTRGDHANHYTTDVVHMRCKVGLS